MEQNRLSHRRSDI